MDPEVEITPHFSAPAGGARRASRALWETFSEGRIQPWAKLHLSTFQPHPSPWKREAKLTSLSALNMCETHNVRKERKAGRKGHWGSSWEYEDRRSLQKRDLTGPDGLYREGSSDSRDWTSGHNRPYRKRHCGYWAFEHSEPSSNHEEAEESRKDCMDYASVSRGCGGYGNSEDVDDGNLSPETKDDWRIGSPESWKAGGYGQTNGFVDGQNLNCNPEDSKETGRQRGHSGLDDAVGSGGQPEKWHRDHRNFNYNVEDCKETNTYCRNRNNLCQAPGNYTNCQSVDFPDLNGVNEGKEFVEYYEGERDVYQNDKACPKAKTPAMDQSDSESENKGHDTLFANCEYTFQNYIETDLAHQMKNLEDSGTDRAGIMALGSGGIFPDGLRNQWTRGDRGEHHSGALQGSSLGKNTWHLEAERKTNGPETWKRNSCFRRTAPSTLRRSEFVQNRKKTQGRNSASLLRRLEHENR